MKEGEVKISEVVPPFKWYVGICYGDAETVLVVVTSREFEELDGGRVSAAYHQWAQLTFPQHYSPLNLPPDEVERRKKAAEEYVEKITRLSPREILDFGIALNDRYRGERDVPFKTRGAGGVTPPQPLVSANPERLSLN